MAWYGNPARLWIVIRVLIAALGGLVVASVGRDDTPTRLPPSSVEVQSPACLEAVRAGKLVAKAAGSALYVAPDTTSLVRTALQARSESEISNVKEHLGALTDALRTANAFSERGDPPAWRRFDTTSARCLGEVPPPPLRQDPDDVAVSIPLVGRLTWRCDDDHEFTFNFTADEASVVVEQSIDGEVTKKRLYPGETLTTGFLPAEVHREWGVTYRHAPTIISAGIYVEPDVRDGSCFIRYSTLEQNRRVSSRRV